MTLNRRNFLKQIGLTSLGIALTPTKVLAKKKHQFKRPKTLDDELIQIVSQVKENKGFIRGVYNQKLNLTPIKQYTLASTMTQCAKLSNSPIEEIQDLTEESINFLESQGFDLNNQNFEILSEIFLKSVALNPQKFKGARTMYLDKLLPHMENEIDNHFEDNNQDSLKYGLNILHAANIKGNWESTFQAENFFMNKIMFSKKFHKTSGKILLPIINDLTLMYSLDKKSLNSKESFDRILKTYSTIATFLNKELKIPDMSKELFNLTGDTAIAAIQDNSSSNLVENISNATNCAIYFHNTMNLYNLTSKDNAFYETIGLLTKSNSLRKPSSKDKIQTTCDFMQSRYLLNQQLSKLNTDKTVLPARITYLKNL